MLSAKENLQTAFFRITRYIGNVFITNAAQIWQERPKNSILFSDELCHLSRVCHFGECWPAKYDNPK